MKTILLMRHAKSDWDATHADDHARPLATRGVDGAAKMGRWITTTAGAPDRALTSSAVRARQTLALAAAAGGWTGEARVSDRLYESTPEAVLDEIRAEPDSASTLVVVGHEPTTSRLVALLTGGGHVEIKTGAVAQIDVPVMRWADVQPARGVLAALASPASVRPGAYRRLKEKLGKGGD